MSYPASWHTPTAGKLGQQDENQQYPPGSHPENRRQVLTPEEVRTLRECNTESFYYRCVPLATLFSGLSFIAMKNGYLKKSPKYGYAPKMMIGAFLGYIGGKFSYQTVCAEKIMRLPNSSLAEVLRKRKGLTSYEDSANTEPGFSQASQPSADFKQDNTMFDERRPDYSEHEEGSDGYQKVQDSLLPYSDADQSSPNKYASYDELRRENRDEYMVNKLSDKYKRENELYKSSREPSSFPGSSFSDPPYSSRQTPDEPRSGPPAKPEPYFNPTNKNKYGDVWEQ